ncbi:MAG: cupin domain-containing protein [Prolixibacteraceae bacterium]|jgi:glucose-6-phosphate isomerase|nr:cupin domain-containing protein [Prolixibacteraceae bacterium]
MEAKNKTTFLNPFSLGIDLATGDMPEATNHLIRRASDMKGYYLNENALEELIKRDSDPIHYEVFEIPVPEEYGHLMYCISKLFPGKIGEEYFFTKGHYHTVEETAEIYLCLKGEGYMVMKTSDGKSEEIRMERGQMVYVPPFWAHRSVNTGTEPLISFCVYPAEAGHNYGDIKEQGFPKRIFEKGNAIRII